MIIESNPKGERGFLVKALSEFAGSKQKSGLFTLPERFGKGYIKSFDLGASMFVMVHQYVLNENITLKRMGATGGKEMITFSFRNVLPVSMSENGSTPKPTSRVLPSVQVSSGDIDLEIVTPAGTLINTIIINFRSDLLKDLLNKKGENTALQTIISGDQTYLYDEIISPEIQKAAAKFFEVSIPDVLNDFYIRLRAEELVYLFFTELLKRQTIEPYPLNASDVNVMYAIRSKVMEDLSMPPDLSELTVFSGMSESKMNRLFKQIFGTSIYNYYQALRMKEAAQLIKEERLSVSEVGYRLGFTNLSHFSRLFERHIGMKPKKYSA